MKIIAIIICLTSLASLSSAQHIGHAMPHEMQHGFVLAADDKLASHLVAPGHHSRQVEITGQLSFDDPEGMMIYQERKKLSAGNSYFIFQAQNLDLPSLKDGQVLTGHIVESKTADYEPKNIIVKKATYRIEKVILNIPNPFFMD